MDKKILFGLAFLLLMSFAFAELPSYNLEQEQTSTDVDRTQGNGVAQTKMSRTFVPTTSYDLARWDIYAMEEGSPSGNFEVALYTTSGGLPDTLLGTSNNSYSASVLTGTRQWFEFTFEEPIKLTSGTRYAIVHQGINTDSGNAINIAGRAKSGETLGNYQTSWSDKGVDEEATYKAYSCSNCFGSQNLTITVTDQWDNSALSDINATITYPNSTTQTFSNMTGNIIFTNIPLSDGFLVDVDLEAGNYFDKSLTDINISSNLATTMYQAEARFNASELYTNATVLGNFTIYNGTANTTKASNEIFYMKEGNYTVYYENNMGYYNKTQNVEVLALDNTTYTITDVYDSNLTITATSLFDNETISNFTFTIFNKNVTLSYNATGGNQTIPQFLSGVYNITASATGFFNFSQGNITIEQGTSSYNIGFQEEGALAFFIRDIDTAALIGGSNTTVKFNNATQELTFSTTSGVGSIEGLTVNNSYDVVITNSLYQIAYTGFTYLQDVEQYDFYLTPNGTEININVNSVDGTGIRGALVQVITFVNGNPELVQSAFTDVRGYTRFVLPVDKTYFVTVTADGFVSLEDLLINFNNPDVSITLESSESDLIITGTEGIRYSITPTNTIIETNDTIVFNYTLFAAGSDLESFTLSLYNGTDLLTYLDSTNATGGTLTYSFNSTNYTEQTIRLVATYTIQDQSQQSLTRLYKITESVVYTGSLLELRDWMLDNLDDVDRFAIFVLAFFMTMIILAIFIKGFANVIISTLAAFFVGWLVGMSLFLIISIGGILILGMLAWSNDLR